MTPRVPPSSSPSSRSGVRGILAVAVLAVISTAAPPASAMLRFIVSKPEAPTTCDPVTLIASGFMSDPCYHLIGAEIEGPVELPTMGPIPTYGIRIRLTVQEPNPLLDIACPTVTQPYERAFPLGRLPFGQYWVTGVEYLVPFSPDSSAMPKDSSEARYTFSVGQARDCPPISECYILDFGPRVPMRPDAGTLCTSVGQPGSRTCFDVTLLNAAPVGGLQTTIEVVDPRVDPVPGGLPPPASMFEPISVEITPRARGFQLAWTAEGSRAKILLFSTTAVPIEPGNGPILHVCYAIGASTPEGAYPLVHRESVVSDPDGNALEPCPTFAPIAGRLCVFKQSCDVNGDGASNILDVVGLVRCALEGHGGTEACPDSIAGRSDCNGDGSLDVRDVVCCVRRILAEGITWGYPGGPPDTTGATRVGFLGPVEWTSPTEGRVSIQILPGDDLAGVQFTLNTNGATVRGMSLVSGAGDYALQWSTDPIITLNLDPIRVSRAILYRAGATPPPLGAGGSAGSGSTPITIRVLLEPSRDAGSRWLSLGSLFGATSAAVAAPTLVTNGYAELPFAPTLSAPTVLAPRPNPFATETDIAYAMPAPGRVTLRIYDVNGRLVRTLVDAEVPAGIHHAPWDGTDQSGKRVRSGIYFSKFSTGSVERTDRILRLK